ncbi:MAG TPA: aromatic amino acid ammonia-lyase [Pseudonocardiaceae bacterium]|jgi:histidine ammonia-lyase/phenylalanine ammonia-lyase|nr:aromatic amino acid ammonia-lyase [Pseudonocardiaceae bacterium]
MAVLLDGAGLTLADVAAVAVDGQSAQLAEGAECAMRASRELKEKLLRDGNAIYGVTTGFGDSVIRQIAPVKAAELQRNLIRYHVNGTGRDAPTEVVRATLLIRANCLAKGNSGIRPEVVSRLLWHLDNDVLPRVPERGSVGASGDLVPLCYVASALIGEGQLMHEGRLSPANEVLAQLSQEPVELEAKEGLALINGTSFSSAFAAIALLRADQVVAVAELCTAMASEAILGNRGHFTKFIHEAKPHPGQLAAAEAIAIFLADSGLALDHSQVVELTGGLGGHDYRELPRPIQDRYSIRCAPHVIGVLRDTLDWARRWVEIEINSSNDNPLFDVANNEVHSGGNFYGGHIAQSMDSLKTAVANIADLLDRQLELVVDEKFNNGLTPNLVLRFELDQWRAGLHHGFKGMQIACSAITAEALKHSAPASVFSRSTEAHNQDKVSMSAMAARDALHVVELVEEVTAIHLLALCQALDLRGVDKSAKLIQQAHLLIREHAPTVADDRAMEGDITAVLKLIRSGELSNLLPN